VGGPPIPVWAKIVYYLGVVNLWVALFNMIPIPPLDGSVLLERLLPRSWWPGYLRIRPYTLPILFGLVLADYALHLGLLNALHNDVDTWWANLSGLT
jgi:Zn-dependent protease